MVFQKRQKYIFLNSIQEFFWETQNLVQNKTQIATDRKATIFMKLKTNG